MLALDYVILLAELQPAKAKTAALRWHGRIKCPEGPNAIGFALQSADCTGAGEYR
jgi:hypothetical protein